MMKLCDKEIAKTKKKEESSRNKKERIDTLDKFLFEREEKVGK